ncbi:MAG: hypothetical protein QG657_3933 [Acidobacteriota bacterium]|nr:hypothetical protein [Acidobacteriota bacterium]
MKKLTINAELRNGLKNLREKLGPTIPDDTMAQLVAGGCGGVCKITCSWWCRADIVSEEIGQDPLPPKE